MFRDVTSAKFSFFISHWFKQNATYGNFHNQLSHVIHFLKSTWNTKNSDRTMEKNNGGSSEAK